MENNTTNKRREYLRAALSEELARDLYLDYVNNNKLPADEDIKALTDSDEELLWNKIDKFKAKTKAVKDKNEAIQEKRALEALEDSSYVDDIQKLESRLAARKDNR